MRRRSRTVLFALAAAMLFLAILTYTEFRSEVSPGASDHAAAVANAPPLDSATLTPQIHGNQPAAVPTDDWEPEPTAETEPEHRSPPRQAQERRQFEVTTAGIPHHRVRGNPDMLEPEELRVRNRIVLSHVNVKLDSLDGMQIGGRLLTDFLLDRPPQTLGLPPGQLLDLSVHVQLYQVDCVLKRRQHDDQPVAPRLDHQDFGTPVQGQQVTVRTSLSVGDFGAASFSLPSLPKPLPPGVYRLVTTLRLDLQEPGLREAMKWCSSLYGARVTLNEETLEPELEPVFDNPRSHDEAYGRLLHEVCALSSEAVIYLGETLVDDAVFLAGPGHAKPNIVILDLHQSVAEEVEILQDQLDNADQIFESEVREAMNMQDAKAARERLQQAEQLRAIILNDNEDLIQLYGGRVSRDERAMLERNRAATQLVLQQIAKFQDRLTYNYWVILDGLLTYHGFNSLNVAGYNTWEAVYNGRTTGTGPRPDPEIWKQREEAWKYMPPEITQVAFDYLRTKEESNTWHATSFTTRTGASVTFDRQAWRAFAEDHLGEWQHQLDARLSSVRTTERYAIQTWQPVLDRVMAAREVVWAFALSWEFITRTNAQHEDAAAVEDEWNSAQSRWEMLFTTERMKAGRTYPGTLKQSFDAHLAAARSALHLSSFAVRWRQAIEGNSPPPGFEK